MAARSLRLHSPASEPLMTSPWHTRRTVAAFPNFKFTDNKMATKPQFVSHHQSTIISQKIKSYLKNNSIQINQLKTD